MLAFGFQLVLGAVQRDLPGGDFDFEVMQSLANAECLLVQQLDGDAKIGLGFTGSGLFLVHEGEELFAVFGKAFEGGLRIRHGAQQLADEPFAGTRQTARNAW